MTFFSFDEINALYGGKSGSVSNALELKRRSIPFEQYFGEMQITAKQKQKREDFAEEIKALLLFYFAYIQIYGGASANVYRSDIEAMFRSRYTDLIKKHKSIDDYMLRYINKSVTDITSVTIRHASGQAKEDPYYFSEDRAIVIAENEANGILGYDEFTEALQSGKTRKQWLTMKDKKVRDTHRVLDDKIIGISELFNVGGSMMLFPKDISHDPSDEEIMGCRCSIKYLE
jgi:hypothetical protein